MIRQGTNCRQIIDEPGALRKFFRLIDERGLEIPEDNHNLRGQFQIEENVLVLCLHPATGLDA